MKSECCVTCALHKNVAGHRTSVSLTIEIIVSQPSVDDENTEKCKSML